MALAGDWVEELVVVAGHLNAVSAAAAVIVESLRRVAISRRLGALASAVLRNPFVVLWASLVEASALTLYSVEIMAVQEACLWRALKFARVGVEDHVGMFFPCAISEPRFAEA